MQRKHLARLSTVVGIGLGVAAVAFVVRFLARDWDEVSDSLADARPGWLLAAFAAAALAMTAIAVPWRKVLRVLGGDLPMGDVIARYYAGEIGKYLPGGLWPVLGRGELAVRGGVARTAAYGSVALSLALLYLAAMFVVLVSVPFMIAGGGSLRYLWVLAVLPLGLAVLHHTVLEKLRATASRLTGRELDVVIPAWKDSLALLVGYVPSWLFVGTATWLVARGLGAEASWADIAPAAVLSWVVGFVLIPVPGGVGVREAAFLAAASASLEPGVGAAVALVARVLFVLVDVAGFLLASAWLARRRGETRPGPAAPATASTPATTATTTATTTASPPTSRV